VGQVLQDLESDRPVSRHHGGIGDGMDEEAIETGIAMLDENPPPFVEWNANHPAAQPLDGGDLRGRGVLGHHDRAGDAHAPRVPGDALGHVSRARRVHAVPERLTRREPQRVRRAADLERADGLEVLALEPDLARRIVHVQSKERRPDDRAGDGFARGANRRDRRRLKRPHGVRLRS
jgi:hypothetical protein